MRLMSESHWWYLIDKDVKIWDSTTWFKIWKFQTPAKKRDLQIHLLTEWLVCKAYDYPGFNFWKMVSRPIQWHQCCLLTRQVFIRLHMYSLWRRSTMAVVTRRLRESGNFWPFADHYYMVIWRVNRDLMVSPCTPVITFSTRDSTQSNPV